MKEVMDMPYGNPSSPHSVGSEANNQAILSGLYRIVPSSVEHSSIKKLCENLIGIVGFGKAF